MTKLVSRTAADPLRGGNRLASRPVVSDDGSKVLFRSASTDIVPYTPPSGPNENLFVYDVATGTVKLVTSDFANPNFPAASADAAGVFTPDSQGVIFSVRSTRMLPGQTENTTNIYHRDLTTGATTMLTQAPGGGSPNGIGGCALKSVSADGRFVAFTSTQPAIAGFVDNNGANYPDLFRLDRVTGAIALISRSASSPLAGASGAVNAHRLALSADGQVVAFTSAGTNLVDGLTYNGPAGAFQTYVFENGSVSLISKDVVDPLATGNGTTSS
ncbi:MAG: hypothetical protein K1X57_14400, partial [Gemmataceae bacterium]|nr:hypothetical protein [Gemmataceae bacterium]